MRIVLDAGHGANTPGKRTPKFSDGTFMHEHEFNNAVVKKLKPMLEKYFEILVVSDDVADVPMSERVKKERQFKANLFLSVHANALTGNFETSKGKGIESFYNKGSVKGEAYCKIIHAGLIKDTGLHDRTAKSAPGPLYPTSLYMLKNTYAPAVLVECGFMDNLKEAELLRSDDYRNKVAKSLYNSICKIFNIEEVDYKKLYEEASEKLRRIGEIL